MVSKDIEASIGCPCHDEKVTTLFPGSQDPREDQQSYSTSLEKTRSCKENDVLGDKTFRV